MTKGNPLWETSYHSIATIKKKKKQSVDSGPPLLAKAVRSRTRGSLCSSFGSYFASSPDPHRRAKLPKGGHVHRQGAHVDVRCASSPMEGEGARPRAALSSQQTLR